ncbi:serine hydrolase domain-containing protein [Actinosynnema sp. NPDC050801]|uniref:serine hydrolase domain-containing protein n=1 Tax=unclassified Actinosynnema TaxID=2637065 RepID=UPI0033DF056B
MSVDGVVAPGFEGVREEFAVVVAAEPDPGAQLAVYHHGRPVVDLWAGLARDALLALYSSGKGAAHLVVALLVQDGVLDLDRAVASYWPEFAAGGKERLTLRDLLAHRAGLVGVTGGFDAEEVADDRLIAARLAGERPAWTDGYGYHALTIGALTGEVVRRVTGRTLREVYEERVRAPYGLDLHLGLPAELEPRYAPVRPTTSPPPAAPEGLTALAFNAPFDLVAFANTRRVRALGQASAGSVGNARGLARMYAAAIGPVDGRAPLLKPDVLGEFTRPHSAGVDLVTGERDHFLLGFEAQGVRYPELGADAFGHSGAVGAQAFADPGSGVAYSYTRRRFVAGGGGGAPENRRLVAAVLRAVA